MKYHIGLQYVNPIENHWVYGLLSFIINLLVQILLIWKTSHGGFIAR